MAKRTSNIALRLEMARTGVTFSEIANAIGVHLTTLMSWTKKELSEDKRDTLIAIVRDIAKNKECPTSEAEIVTEEQKAVLSNKISPTKWVRVSKSDRKSNNRIVRDAMAEHGILQWELAEMLGIREEWLSRKMRHEMPIEEQEEIVKLIEGVDNE